MIKEIMLVPFPRAASSRLINFLTFHISICSKVVVSVWLLKLVPDFQGPRMATCSVGFFLLAYVFLGFAGVGVAHFDW